jgi:hypothetical protein
MGLREAEGENDPPKLGSGFAAHFGPPPACPYEKKTPIVEELGLFALKGVANELQGPSEDEQAKGVHPEPMEKDGGYSERKRHEDERNAEGMAHPVDWMLVASCVLRNPLFVGSSA